MGPFIEIMLETVRQSLHHSCRSALKIFSVGSCPLLLPALDMQLGSDNHFWDIAWARDSNKQLLIFCFIRLELRIC